MYAYTATLEAAEPTVFMFWLPACKTLQNLAVNLFVPHRIGVFAPHSYHLSSLHETARISSVNLTYFYV
jgi:hypothetical protein